MHTHTKGYEPTVSLPAGDFLETGKEPIRCIYHGIIIPGETFLSKSVQLLFYAVSYTEDDQ